MSSPVLSVVMPVYNAQRYLALATESILKQTFGDFEFIIIDDGSTDRSRVMLEGYAKGDARIRLISRPNVGQARSREEGFRAARGEFLASMDADDISRPDRFAAQLEYLQANPRCVLVGAEVEEIDPEGYSLGEIRKPLGHADIEAAMLKGDGGAIHQSVAMMRREALQRVGGYQIRFPTTEDIDLFLRLAEVGRIGNVPRVLLKYRVHFSSQNRIRFQSQLDDLPRVVSEALVRRGISPPVDFSLPIGPPLSPLEQRRFWAMRCRRSGNWRGAVRQGAIAIAHKPVSRESIKLVYRLMRGR